MVANSGISSACTVARAAPEYLLMHSQYWDSDQLRQENSTLITLCPAVRELLGHILFVGSWTEYIMSTQLRHGIQMNPSILCGYIWLSFIHLRRCAEPVAVTRVTSSASPSGRQLQRRLGMRHSTEEGGISLGSVSKSEGRQQVRQRG